MFVSQERGAARKPFQKPNILRRKSKAAKLSTEKNTEFSDTKSSLCSTSSEIRLVPKGTPMLQSAVQQSQRFQIVEAPTFAVVNIEELYNENQVDTSQTLEINGDSLTIYAHNSQMENSDVCIPHSSLNVESFLNGNEQSKVLINIDGTSKSDKVASKPKWCLDFVNESKNEISYYDDGSQINNIQIDKSLNVSTDGKSEDMLGSLLGQANTTLEVMQETSDNSSPIHNCYMKLKFMCEEPGCNKSFWTESYLEKHKNSHKSKTPVVLHCPVKRTDADGVETKCCRTFLVRRLLTKHLNEDHSPEDALYKCAKCGRRFFWAGGARQHQASECGRAYACLWAGCGRVFRQPCRLREHARAHTGDRPYACNHPGCSWSFRSNSKLVRHARRHTGERRHACAACGRAFLRPEHLREHAARHHAAPPHAHRCTHADCERSFTNSSSLVAHVKKVHTKQEGKPQATKRQRNTKQKKQSMLVSAQIPKLESGVESTVSDTCEILETVQTTPVKGLTIERDSTMIQAEGMMIERESATGDVEERCARTHCTWPLLKIQETYTLEDDTQVEQAGSESCESNIYTVRSDLFLHGNLLVNEDSEFIISRAATGGECGEGGAGAGEEGGARDGGAALDTLGLIDSHPTIDLTQEELMYADAVDESSFRVFLLNGEELT